MRANGDRSGHGGLVSLWLASLDLAVSERRRAAEMLTPVELGRAGQYRRPVDRDRFVAARAALRRVLADELDCAPLEVRIVTDAGGKPSVEGLSLRFNASRSAHLALVATSFEMEVGVDIERVRADADIEGIAARFFSPAEQRALAALPPEERLVASFRCWTRKEAYVKGTGTGLRVPIDEIEVWTKEGGPATLGDWRIHGVEPVAGFVASVAGNGPPGWLPGEPRTL